METKPILDPPDPPRQERTDSGVPEEGLRILANLIARRLSNKRVRASQENNPKSADPKRD